MNIYAGLFDSMLECCDRSWLRNGPVYTLSMVALGAGVSLNILTLVHLLCLLGVLNDPYRSAGAVHPQRYLCAVLYIVFLANTLLARRCFSVKPRSVRPLISAPPYLIGSAALFLITLRIYI